MLVKDHSRARTHPQVCQGYRWTPETGVEQEAHYLSPILKLLKTFARLWQENSEKLSWHHHMGNVILSLLVVNQAGVSKAALPTAGIITVAGSLGWVLLAPALPTSFLLGPVLPAAILHLGQGKPRTGGGAAVSVGHWRWA